MYGSEKVKEQFIYKYVLTTTQFCLAVVLICRGLITTLKSYF